MLASHAFSPKTSIYSKKAAVDSTFKYSLYRGRVAIVHRVFYMVAFYAFTAFFYRHFYSISAYLAMYIVDLYLCQWPSSLCCCGSALLVQCWVSACCCSSFCIFCSLSAACRRSVSWLIYLGMLPLQRGLSLCIHFSTWCISFFTKCLCTVAVLCIAVISI